MLTSFRNYLKKIFVRVNVFHLPDQKPCALEGSHSPRRGRRRWDQCDLDGRYNLSCPDIP